MGIFHRGIPPEILEMALRARAEDAPVFTVVVAHPGTGAAKTFRRRERP